MYYTKRYSSESPRYVSAYTSQHSFQPDLASYYTGRYADYSSRYPATAYAPAAAATAQEATSPGWRRRSYDPDVDYGSSAMRRAAPPAASASVTSSFGRPLTELTGGNAAAAAMTPASLAMARDQFYEAPFRPKTFRITFHPQFVVQISNQNNN
jgi:hypothetical protein